MPIRSETLIKTIPLIWDWHINVSLHPPGFFFFAIFLKKENDKFMKHLTFLEN